MVALVFIVGQFGAHGSIAHHSSVHTARALSVILTVLIGRVATVDANVA